MRRSGKRNVAVVSNRVSRHEGMPTSDEICEDCGGTGSEPNAPHTRCDCEKCGKQRFGTAGPEGVKTEPGDTFVIPAGFLTMSLDPTQSNGRLMRPGMTWLVREGFFANASEDADGVGLSLDAYEEQADKILKVSEVLKGIDLDSEGGVEEAIDRIGKDETVPEFWALRLGVLASLCRHHLADEEPEQAVWAMQRAALSNSMLYFVTSLEALAWRGYRTFGIAELEAALKLWEQSSGQEAEEFWQSALSELASCCRNCSRRLRLSLRSSHMSVARKSITREGVSPIFLSRTLLRSL